MIGLRKAWLDKQCLHPSADSASCTKIIAAHTLQRRNVLEALVDQNNHVKTFAPDITRGSQKGLKNIGWKEASTFNGFCGTHDAMFEPIERHDFTGTDEQCFLIGFRALCHEIHQKQAAIRAYGFLARNRDRGYPNDRQIEDQHAIALMIAGSKKGLDSFLLLKEEMDQDYLREDFSHWDSLIVLFGGPLSVASTGIVSPNRTIAGEKLQTLHDPTSEQQSVLFGVIRTDKGGAIVFVWRRGHLACERFMQSLLTQSKSGLPQVLVQFMFAYVSNTFFSEAWWKTLSVVASTHIAKLALMSNAYYTDFEYRRIRVVPWKIQQVFFRGNEQKLSP